MFHFLARTIGTVLAVDPMPGMAAATTDTGVDGVTSAANDDEAMRRGFKSVSLRWRGGTYGVGQNCSG